MKRWILHLARDIVIFYANQNLRPPFEGLSKSYLCNLHHLLCFSLLPGPDSLERHRSSNICLSGSLQSSDACRDTKCRPHCRELNFAVLFSRPIAWIHKRRILIVEYEKSTISLLRHSSVLGCFNPNLILYALM
jgi:hypothetical protein